jgi:superfamily II DNA or RNA helicase
MGVGISATGSGKTMALYAMCRYLINEKSGTRIVIIVPNTTLVDQGLSDFIEYSELDEWDCEENCERMRSGVSPTFEKSVLITTWQSLKGARKEFFEKFNHVFVDEVHGADADVLKSLILRSKNAYTKIGMTGSLKGTGKQINTESEMSLLGLFARIETFSTAPMLMDLGILPRLKMVLLRVIYPQHVKKSLKVNSQVERNKKLGREDHLKLFREEQDFVLGIEERKKLISTLADGLNGSGVAFFNSIERMHETEEFYRNSFKGRKKSGTIFGGTKLEARKDILYTQLEDTSQEYQLFSTLRTTSTGISVDNLRYGILADSTKARVTVLQSIGRLLRGDEAIVIDIEDDIDNRKGFLSRHARERKELYESLGYPFEEKTLVLEVDSISGLDSYQICV